MKRRIQIIAVIIIIICIVSRIIYVNVYSDKVDNYVYEFGEECCLNDIVYKIRSVNVYEDIEEAIF